MVNKLVTILVILLALQARAQDLKTVLATYQKAYELDLEKAEADSKQSIIGWSVQYVQLLDSLEKKFQGAGDLGGLVAVRKERARFTETKQIPDDAVVAVPQELADLQGKAIKALQIADLKKNRQIVAGSNKYVAALEDLKKNLTKQGKVDDAVEVNAEIARVKERPEVTAAQFTVAAVAVDTKVSEPATNSAPKVAVVQAKGIPAALKSAMILYFSFDGSLGKTVADKSGKGHEGKLHGVKWAPKGKVSGACEFNGSSDYIIVPNSPQFDFGTSDFAISAWIYPRENAQNAIVSKSVANDQGYFFTQADKDRLQFLAGAGGDWSVNTRSSPGLSLAAWNHVVVSQDSGQIHFWINGVSCGGGAGGSVNGDATNLLIGGSSWGDLTFKGMIDEVMIFNRALTDDEVRQIYDAQR